MDPSTGYEPALSHGGASGAASHSTPINTPLNGLTSSLFPQRAFSADPNTSQAREATAQQEQQHYREFLKGQKG